MIDPQLQLRQTLKKHHKSITEARQAVFEAFLDKEPLLMQELVKTCLYKVDRASIYRTVSLYERLGIIQRLQIGWKYKLELSHSFNYHHHHLTCNRCDTVIPLPEDDELENRLTKLASDLAFYPIDHQIEIRGLCSKCRRLS